MAAKRLFAQVTPRVLSWARNDAGYLTPEQAVKRLPKNVRVDASKLESWERGDTQPTMRQAKALAKLYHRPFTMFYLTKPPQSIALAAEYRRLTDVQPGHESPELRVALRSLIQRRKDVLRLMNELNETPSDFRLLATLDESPSEIASRFRTELRITEELQNSWKDKYSAWSGWRRAIESIGALVMQFTDVPLDEIRGVALYHEILPVIGVNSKDDASARPFTALHELIHLALNNAGQESAAISETRSSNDWMQLERFVERVASEILMPTEVFLNRWQALTKSDTTGITHEQIAKLARQFNASPLAAATRLQILGAITWGAYQAWIEWWDGIVQAKRGRDAQRVKKGGPAPYLLALSNHGPLYSWLVFDALAENRIGSVEALHMMGLNPDQMQKAKQHLVGGVTQVFEEAT